MGEYNFAPRERKQDEKFMREAIRQAKKAYALGESPIGCVIVRDDKIIARGYNRRNTDKIWHPDFGYRRWGISVL